MLNLQIAFPAGRYYAAAIADPRQPEWPPHPSRVYSALVAAAYSGGRQPSDEERSALHRLESAPPPALRFPDADLRSAPDSFVPVNDVKSRVDAKKGQSQGVLFANRQVRQFPVAFLLGEPEVTLTWPIDLQASEVQVLDRLASRVTHVGTSHTFVAARFTTDDVTSPPRLVPRTGGTEFLRNPRQGRLDELDQIASQGNGTLRRPPPRCEVLVPYGFEVMSGRAKRSLSHDWVSLRFSGASWGADTAHTLARALRRAVLSIAGDGAPAVIHGHDPTVEHLAWLPLPDVGHVHARGRIRGLAVALPLSASVTDRGIALAALSRLVELSLPDGQTAQVSPSIDGVETPVALRASTWLGPSTHWSTVTPLLLDRPPKRSTPEAVVAAVVDSLVNAGYPVPTEVHAGLTSDFEGAPGAREIPTSIPRYHVRIAFAEVLHGPVLAGRWRNFGIGLFRPTPPELRT